MSDADRLIALQADLDLHASQGYAVRRLLKKWADMPERAEAAAELTEVLRSV